MKIVIRSPVSMQSERAYVYRLIFAEFLGIEHTIEESTPGSVKLVIGDSIICVPDIFLSSAESGWLSNDFYDLIGPLRDWPSAGWAEVDSICPLFPKNVQVRDPVDRSDDGWDFNFDLLGAIFFLISRYEEGVVSERDSHGRFELRHSVLRERGLIFRPLVNEYLQLLKNLILKIDPSISFRDRKFRQIISCDVDFLTFPPIRSNLHLPVYFLNRLLKPSRRRQLWRDLVQFLKARFSGYQHDPFNGFRFLLQGGVETNSSLEFYLMTGDGRESQDGGYRLEDLEETGVAKTLCENKLVNIGLHGSYSSHVNVQELRKQRERLNDFLRKYEANTEVVMNRQHYLRWDQCLSPAAITAAGMKVDSTLGYAESVGFRSSCCYSYPLYDIINRTELELIERPLMIMDVSLLEEKYMGIKSTREAIDLVWSIKEQCRQYDGDFTLLWHNSSFLTRQQRDIFDAAIATEKPL